MVADTFTSLQAHVALDLRNICESHTSIPDAPTFSESRSLSDKSEPHAQSTFSEPAVLANDPYSGSMPFLIKPLSENEGGADSPWLAPGSRATDWLSLFYDLVVVAVLTVFSATHELSSPSAITVFLSYFVILAWLWTAQVHYDIRFQAEDIFHRCAKFLQVIVLVYVGAASGSWYPMNLAPANRDDEVDYRDFAKYEASLESFTTIATAFAISRAAFASQYGTMAWLGHRAGRPVSGQVRTAVTLLASCGLSIFANVLSAKDTGTAILKCTVFYGAILLEAFSVWYQYAFGHHVRFDTKEIGKRYGAFTLIIIGEGFIASIRGFSKAISGLSFGSTATYLQVFLAISIMCLLWILLFSSFRPEVGTTQKRALVWEGIHLPLHFGLLLLLAAIVNVVTVLSYVGGIDVVSIEFVEMIRAIDTHQPLSPAREMAIASYLDRLPLAPSFEQQFGLLSRLSNETLPDNDPLVLAYQYFAQIVVDTTVSYGISVDEDTLELLEQIYALNTSLAGDLSIRAERLDEARELMIAIVEDPVDDSMSGTLWLFPCAGGVLVLIALRSIAWAKPMHVSSYVICGLQIVLGLGLGLLGLLDIGSRRITVDGSNGLNHRLNPLYVLLQERLPLLVVLGVYAMTVLAEAAVVRISHRRYMNTHQAV